MPGAAEAASHFEHVHEDSLSHDEPLRQGDVLEFIEPYGTDLWRQHFAVLVTADCDLALGKHSGILTYTPLVPVSVYMATVALPRRTEAMMKKERLNIAGLLPQQPTLAERLIQDLVPSPDDDISRVCKMVASHPDADRLQRSLRILRLLHLTGLSLQEASRTGDLATAAAAWEELSSGLDTVSKSKAGKHRKEQDGNLYNSLTGDLPGDTFFINTPAPGRTGGYVAILRLMREIEQKAVATSPIFERHTDTTPIARRIGRLETVYTHRLVQQMAQVFTDIGLPAAYESERRRNARVLVDAIFPTIEQTGTI